MPTRAFLCLSAVVLVATAGCGPARLDEKKTYQLTPGDTKMMILPKQPKPQRITVEFESDQPIEVGIYRSSDVTQDTTPPASKALGIERAKATGTVTADLGPDEATTVTFSALGKAATVKAHVHNKK
ncbi:MAG: hypothetical protein U0804_14180 [Gemmataceae bacterium]